MSERTVQSIPASTARRPQPSNPEIEAFLLLLAQIVRQQASLSSRNHQPEEEPRNEPAPTLRLLPEH
jgi:hypothetical protein